MMIPKIPGLCSILALAAMLAVPAHAALITGVSIEGVSSQLGAPTFNRQAAFVVNGAGFNSITGTHSTAPDGTMWLTNGNFRSPNDLIGPFPNSYIEFDLGANHNLDRFIVWNYNEINLTNRGANRVNISVAPSDVAPVFTSLGEFTFDQAPVPASATTNFGQLIDLSSFAAANDVRLVRFDVLSNHGGGNNFVGLSEVLFFTPEPSVVTLVGLGGLMMLRRRRRS